MPRITLRVLLLATVLVATGIVVILVEKGRPLPDMAMPPIEAIVFGLIGFTLIGAGIGLVIGAAFRHPIYGLFAGLLAPFVILVVTH